MVCSKLNKEKYMGLIILVFEWIRKWLNILCRNYINFFLFFEYLLEKEIYC